MSERLKEKLKVARLAVAPLGEQHKQITQRHTEALRCGALDSSASAKGQTLTEFSRSWGHGADPVG